MTDIINHNVGQLICKVTWCLLRSPMCCVRWSDLLQSLTGIPCMPCVVGSLFSSDTILWHRSGLTIAQVMAWCLTTTTYYPNQCWLIISTVSYHKFSPVMFSYRDLLIYIIKTILISEIFEMTSKYTRGKWLKYSMSCDIIWDLLSALPGNVINSL